MLKNFLEINRYLALMSYCNTIGQSNDSFSILGFCLAGKRRVHALSFHPLADKTNNELLTETIFQDHTKIALRWLPCEHVNGTPKRTNFQRV